MKKKSTITNNGNYVGENKGTLIQNFYEGLPASTPPSPPTPPTPTPLPDPAPNSRFWLELNRIQHTTVLLGALSMLALTILCCWPSGHAVPSVTPLVVVLSLIGTVGFGYFYYDERAFK